MSKHGWKVVKGLILGLLFQQPSLAGPVPSEDLLARLASESYPERVAAETELREWATGAGESSWDWLLERANGNGCPEVQARAMTVLKDSVLGQLSQKRPGFVGITMAPAELELEGGGFGVQVRMVSPDSPAQKAGLQPNDVVTKLDGEGWDGLDAADSFAARVGKKVPGTKVTLSLLRNDELLDVDVVLGARPWSAGDYGEQRRLFMQQGGFMQRGGGFVFPPAGEKEARDQAFEEWLEERETNARTKVE